MRGMPPHLYATPPTTLMSGLISMPEIWDLSTKMADLGHKDQVKVTIRHGIGRTCLGTKPTRKKKKTKLSTGERMVLGIWFGYQGSVSLEPSLPRTSQFHKPSVSSFLPKPFWVGFLPFVVERLLSDTVLISLHQVQIILQGLFSGKPSHLFYFSLRFFFHYIFLHYNFISLILLLFYFQQRFIEH